MTGIKLHFALEKIGIGTVEGGFNFDHNCLAILDHYIKLYLLWLAKDLPRRIPGQKTLNSEADFSQDRPYAMPKRFFCLQAPASPKTANLRRKSPTKQGHFILRACLRLGQLRQFVFGTLLCLGKFLYCHGDPV